MVKVSEALVKKFWGLVDMSGGPDACWPWTRGRYPGGYGKFYIPMTRKHEGAHRFAIRDSAPAVLTRNTMACHHCDNKLCCNPKHLYWGTAKSNGADVVSRLKSTRIRLENTETDAVVVLEHLGTLKPHCSPRYRVRCKRCLREFITQSTAIRRGRGGCRHCYYQDNAEARVKLLTPGQRFGWLTVVARSDTSRRKWVCTCDCGKTFEALRTNLENVITTSCGCKRRRPRALADSETTKRRRALKASNNG